MKEELEEDTEGNDDGNRREEDGKNERRQGGEGKVRKDELEQDTKGNVEEEGVRSC